MKHASLKLDTLQSKTAESDPVFFFSFQINIFCYFWQSKLLKVSSFKVFRRTTLSHPPQVPHPPLWSVN